MWRVSAFDRQGREVAHSELEAGEITIGRDSDRTIILPSPSVSRRHARLYVESGRLYVADEGSSNGVVINGIRIGGPTAILDGMRVELAEFRLNVERILMTDAVAPLDMPETTGTEPDRMRLLAEGGPFDGRFFEIAIGQIYLGRALENQLAFDDPSLSRRHALLRVDAGRIEIEDQQSSNGSFINGRRVGAGVANPGDSVRFGELQFRVVGPGSSGTRATRLPGSGRSQWIAISIGGLTTCVALVTLLVMWSRRAPADSRQAATRALAQLTVTAEGHFKSAQSLYADKKYSEALSEVERGLDLDPANADARRLRALAKSAPDDERSFRSALGALSTGVRRGLESALHLRGEISPEAPQYAAITTRLRTHLEQFGLMRCEERGWADCGWALCRSLDLAPKGAQPGEQVGAALREVERRMPRARCFPAR